MDSSCVSHHSRHISFIGGERLDIYEESVVIKQALAVDARR